MSAVSSAPELPRRITARFEESGCLFLPDPEGLAPREAETDFAFLVEPFIGDHQHPVDVIVEESPPQNNGGAAGTTAAIALFCLHNLALFFANGNVPVAETRDEQVVQMGSGLVGTHRTPPRGKGRGTEPDT